VYVTIHLLYKLKLLFLLNQLFLIFKAATGSNSPKTQSNVASANEQGQASQSLNSPTTAMTSNGNNPTTFTPVQPATTNGSSMYPILTPPQFQHILSGVTNAVNSVVRSIPIVTNPNGPADSLTGNSMTDSQSSPLMDSRSVATLNQLLAMGFSNNDGWLTRLVIAKKGDLEAVLNALFPSQGAGQ